MQRSKSIQIAASVVEFFLTISVLALFVYAYPDTYRTTLWTAGGELGWNSNPRMRLYAHANHQEPTEIPLIWSQRLTESNLAVAGLSVLICLARVTLLAFGTLTWLANPIYDMLLLGLWTYSVYAQSSPDFSEKDHPSIRPWYLERGCSVVHGAVWDACVFTKVCYSFSIVSMIFYLIRAVLSVIVLAYWCGRQNIVDRLAVRQARVYTGANQDCCYAWHQLQSLDEDIEEGADDDNC
ncbi:hypothetical protein F5Y15DRAFT_397314 [Xylariaceae sp. FL0016]|nr:hypothetical protein F5Y15DRAFT_397314 [Xylariaceae sp. FL0016]